MIFKFDRVGNMENIDVEGDIQDIARKGKDKDRFNQMDMNVVNQVKEEVLNGMTETQSQVAAGFESLDEIVGDEDMVQQHETELIKEMDTEVDDEKLKQQMRELNMRNMPSLSNLTRMKDEGERNESGGERVGSDKEHIPKDELNEEDSEKQRKKDELAKKREANKLKKQMKERLEKLNSAEDKSFEFDNVLVTMRDGVPKKFHLSLSVTQLAELYLSGRIFYKSSEQRGEKHTKSKGDVPLINVKHTKDILNALLSSSSVNGGCIYLNYSKENEDELFFDSQNNTLSGNSPLSVIDGAHRLESMVLWYRAFSKLKDISTMKNPNDFYFPVTIEMLSNMDAKNVFVELNSFSLPISKTRIAFHDVYNLSNVIAQKVMNESSLRSKIEVISNSLRKSSSNVMTFSSLSKGCSLFSPDTKNQANEIGSYLCDFWDTIIELFPKIYGNVTPEVKQIEKLNTYIGEVMFIHALFGISVELQFVSDWKDKLKKLTQPSSFLSRDNDLWIRNITRNEGKLINTSKTQDFVKDQLLAKVLG